MRESEIFGALRITNKKTLNKWKSDGRYKELTDQGYIYGEGCGRFAKEKCHCSKCERMATYTRRRNEITATTG